LTNKSISVDVPGGEVGADDCGLGGEGIDCGESFGGGDSVEVEGGDIALRVMVCELSWQQMHIHDHSQSLVLKVELTIQLLMLHV